MIYYELSPSQLEAKANEIIERHDKERLLKAKPIDVYDIVGPICESSDVFGKDIELNKAHRGDLIALRSSGAYGEVMASQYNCRKLPKAYYSDLL